MVHHDSTTAVSPTPSSSRDSVAGVKRERADIEVTTGSPAGSANGGGGGGPESKKRKAAPGSRGVANLTPEQLAKKRANDREAQRAIRERTKLTIENLERRIRELTSQQPYQELQAVIRAKEAVEAENADIKRRLASVIAMLQPLVAPSSSSSSSTDHHLVPPSPNHSSFLPAATATTATAALLSHESSSSSTHTMLNSHSHSHNHTATGTTATTTSTPSSAASPPISADPYGASHGHGNGQNPWHSTTGSMVAGMATQQTQTYREQLDQQRHDLAHSLELGTERLGLEFLLDQNKGVAGTGGASTSSGSHRMGQHHHQHHQHPPPLGTPTQETPGGYRPSSHHTNVSPHPHPHPHSPYAHSAAGNGLHSPGHARIDPTIDPALQSAIDPALSNHGNSHSVTPNNNNNSSSSSSSSSSNGNNTNTTNTMTSAAASSSSSSHYAVPIKNCAPTCPLDNLLLDFLQERRQRAAEGFPTQEIIGPRYPSVSSLLNPLKESHPLSKVFIEILHTFPTISQLPERVAVLYIMFLMMRWQIHPSADNYDRLPDFVRPSPAQLGSAHPAWIDHLPFPLLRERLIRDYAPPDVFPFENFFVPFTTTLSLNWPYEDTDTLLQSPDTDELMINPVFERHLRRFENWTIGNAFARAFPMLDGTYNYKADSGPAGAGVGAGARRDSSRAGGNHHTRAA